MLKKTIKRLNIVILIGLMTAGCTYVEKLRGPRGNGGLQVTGDVCNLYPDLKPQEFAEEISRLESIRSKTAEPTLKAQVHLRLGLLHFDKKNPNRDYAASVKEMELYISLDPKGEKKGEIQNLLQILREVEKKKVTIEQRMQENQELNKKLEQLTQENQELNTKLEQLKTLDLNTEERRKQIKK